jgi:hypothetical protein
MKVDTKHKTKESILLELKRNFEQFVKNGALNEGLIINRILFNINPAIKIIKDIEDNNLYKNDSLDNKSPNPRHTQGGSTPQGGYAFRHQGIQRSSLASKRGIQANWKVKHI